MSANSDSPLLNAFDKRVTAFRTNKFILAEDLKWLDKLRGLRAPVAVTLLSARILEVLACEALARAESAGVCHIDMKSPPLELIFQELSKKDRLSRETFRLLTCLRVLGNDARHVRRKLDVPDAEQGYAIILRGLQWFFCEFPEGPKLKSLTVSDQPLDSLLPFEVAGLLALLESADRNEATFIAKLKLQDPNCPLLMSPVLVSVLVEKLLDGKRHEQAQAVLSAALGRFPDDVRLRQLQGLLLSRTGQLEEACEWLEAIEFADSAADEETQGILGGVYKRRAEREPDRREQWLKAAYERYQRAWRHSQATNTYAGINVAALALWLRQPDESTPIAQKVRSLLETQRQRLMQAGATTPRHLNCWDQLTLAEAHLLLQQWDAAGQCYREAAERFPHQNGALEVARTQAKTDLEALGKDDLLGVIFPG